MKVVVRRHRPLQTTLFVILTIVAVGAGGWTVLQRVQSDLDEQIRVLVGQQRRLDERNRRLADENEQLTRKIARIERASQVEAQAYAQVDTDLATLQEELQAAKEELSFYRGIMAESGTQGVRIQRFDIEPGESPKHFRFRLVLTRGLKDDTVLEGTVVLAVEGEAGDKARRLEHADVLPDAARPIVFKFRHFQRIEEEIVLPEGFAPKSVSIQVRPRDKKAPSLDESFAWPS